MRSEIRTSRLLLRRPTEADVEGYLSYRNDPATLNAQMMEAMNERDAISLLKSQSTADTPNHGWLMLALERLDKVGIIGEVGIFISRENPEQGDIGFWLHPAHRKKGYASEAVRALVDNCFSELFLHRITAHALALNEASRKLMSGIGMRLESETVQSTKREGSWHNEVGYAILRDEWNRSAVQCRI